jgi:hypothetical protein
MAFSLPIKEGQNPAHAVWTVKARENSAARRPAPCATQSGDLSKAKLRTLLGVRLDQEQQKHTERPLVRDAQGRQTVNSSTKTPQGPFHFYSPLCKEEKRRVQDTFVS